jgi:hypothetical protein
MGLFVAMLWNRSAVGHGTILTGKVNTSETFDMVEVFTLSRDIEPLCLCTKK